MDPLTKSELLRLIEHLPDNAHIYVGTGRTDWPDGNSRQPIYSVADTTDTIVLEQ